MDQTYLNNVPLWRYFVGPPPVTAIGFLAHVKTRPTYTVMDTLIPFRDVARNDGNGYNSTTSTFTAPVEGIYHIYWNLLVYYSKEFEARLRQNSIVKARHFYKTTNRWDSSSSGGSIYLRLEKGDRLDLMADRSGGRLFGHYEYNRFGGEHIGY